MPKVMRNMSLLQTSRVLLLAVAVAALPGEALAMKFFGRGGKEPPQPNRQPQASSASSSSSSSQPAQRRIATATTGRRGEAGQPTREQRDAFNKARAENRYLPGDARSNDPNLSRVGPAIDRARMFDNRLEIARLLHGQVVANAAPAGDRTRLRELGITVVPSYAQYIDILSSLGVTVDSRGNAADQPDTNQLGTSPAALNDYLEENKAVTAVARAEFFERFADQREREVRDDRTQRSAFAAPRAEQRDYADVPPPGHYYDDVDAPLDPNASNYAQPPAPQSNDNNDDDNNNDGNSAEAATAQENRRPPDGQYDRVPLRPEDEEFLARQRANSNDDDNDEFEHVTWDRGERRRGEHRRGR